MNSVRPLTIEQLRIERERALKAEKEIAERFKRSADQTRLLDLEICDRIMSELDERQCILLKEVIDRRLDRVKRSAMGDCDDD